VTISFVIAAILYGFVATEKYESRTILIEATNSAADMRMGSLLARTGIGSLVGLQGQDAGVKAEALAVLRSDTFLRSFISDWDLLPVLFPGRLDGATGKWKEGEEPSLGDGTRMLIRNVLRISEDRSTGIVTLSVKWDDPGLAADWANDLISRLNEHMRQAVIQEGEESLNYLAEEAEKASNAELRKAIFELMQNQINRIMLANVRPDYAFKVLDPALPPDLDDPVWPNFAALIVLGLLTGLTMGVLVAAVLKPRR